MRKIFFALVVLYLCSTACQEKQVLDIIDENPITLGIHSIADFQDLVDDNIYPINKLSPEILEQFKDGLLFDAGGKILSVYYGNIENILSEQEWDTFWEMIFGEKVQFLDSTNLSEIEQRDCRMIGIIRHHSYHPAYCNPNPNNGCPVCLDKEISIE